MHLKDCPTYFTKDGKRKAVYHTVVARELTEAGWVAEEPPVTLVEKLKGLRRLTEEKAPKEPAPVSTEEPVVQPAPIEEGTSASLDNMTRAELIEFAGVNGVEIKSNALKAEILEACKESVDG
jgi:hypothetical protein